MKVSIIGAGAMGGAIAEGILQRNVLEPADLIVSNRSVGKLTNLSERGVTTTTDNREAVSQADWIILAVKPWLVEGVIVEIRDLLTEDKVIISVAAGIDSPNLRRWTKFIPSLFIAIPNIAIAQGQSMTFITPVSAPDEVRDKVERFFGEMGKTCVCSESQLQAGMALASCGIAYAFRYIRAASEGGVELGFKAGQSQEIVMQTLCGAVALLEAEGIHPEEAIDRVTTPGGLTIKGLNEMEHAGFTSAVIRGLKACIK